MYVYIILLWVLSIFIDVLYERYFFVKFLYLNNMLLQPQFFHAWSIHRWTTILLYRNPDFSDELRAYHMLLLAKKHVFTAPNHRRDARVHSCTCSLLVSRDHTKKVVSYSRMTKKKVMWNSSTRPDVDGQNVIVVLKKLENARELEWYRGCPKLGK